MHALVNVLAAGADLARVSGTQDIVTALVVELKVLRRTGLMSIPRAGLPTLRGLVERCLGLADSDPVPDRAVVSLLEQAVGRLDDDVALAARYTFGLEKGSRHWSAAQRRQRAADVLGIASVETFRGRPEARILQAVAEELMALSEEPEPTIGATPTHTSFGDTNRVSVPHPGGDVTITLHHRPAETLESVDVLVSSENVFLEMAKSYGSSLSASLRHAASVRDEGGSLVDDVLQRELNEWAQARGVSGLSVVPGVVVPTSPGELSRNGVRRIYHAAVVQPSLLGRSYVVTPVAVMSAVGAAFQRLREEHGRYDPPLRSICFPLFGAGRSGLDAATSAEYLLMPLVREARLQPEFDIHIVTRSLAGVQAVLAAAAKG
jgi:O-acetyl-ADP-ribose deacetylase (regulator of RNase III)